jgi:hypothetical protein
MQMEMEMEESFLVLSLVLLEALLQGLPLFQRVSS